MKQEEDLKKSPEEPLLQPFQTKELTQQKAFSSAQIQNFMSLAMEQAKNAFDSDEVPVGCVFVSNSTKAVIAASHNLTNCKKNASRHCEINCIDELVAKGHLKQGNVNLEQATLFVTVQPCIMCSHALNLVNIGKVYFGQYNDRFGGCGSVLNAQKYKFEGGVMEKESIEILKKFYERGNQRIPEQMRNKSRKRVKGGQQS